MCIDVSIWKFILKKLENRSKLTDLLGFSKKKYSLLHCICLIYCCKHEHKINGKRRKST